MAKTEPKTEFHVYKDEGLVRTYSIEDHGDEAEVLAKEFISHHAGTKIR